MTTTLDHELQNAERYDVPPEMRRGALELKALTDRYVSVINRHWAAGGALKPSGDLLLDIARAAMDLHWEHQRFVRSLAREVTDERLERRRAAGFQ